MLAQRLLGDHSLEISDQVPLFTRSESRLEQPLPQGEVELLQAHGLVAGKRLVGDVSKRWAAP